MTREYYLKVLGLGSNATWEEVQSAYARLLEHHLAEENVEGSEELSSVEEAYGFLVQDSVIQARRSLGASSKAPMHSRSTPATPVSTELTQGSDLNALLLVLLCALMFLGAVFVFLNRNLQARTVADTSLSQGQFHQALQRLERQNRQLSQQIDLLDVELARLQRQSLEKPEITPPPSKKTQIPTIPLENTEEIDDSQLQTSEELQFQKLVNLPPAAFTERDKLYVVQSNGELVEGYISITPALIDASIRCDVAQAKALLSDGLDVNQRDQRGDSALAWAVKRDCSPIVRLLLREGVKVDSASENGFTPYLWARLYNNAHMMQLLKRAGADTSRGGYWWRTKEDGKKEYIERSLAAACRDPLASGCQD